MEERAIAWAHTQLGRTITGFDPLEGGRTSTMLRLHTQGGPDAVLRLITNEPWRTHGAELATRESGTQTLLEDEPVPAPRSIALDAAGEHTHVAAHLMSFLPGEPRARLDDAALHSIAGVLADIHAVRPATPPREFQSWAWPAKWVVPEWSDCPSSWRTAFEVLASEAPSFEPTFLHRDFGPHNLLWSDSSISGVVDWVETSTGPAWLDVAHCATNIALVDGPALAEHFAAAYVAVTGRSPQPYWDIMDVVGFLPPPGKPAFITDDAGHARLEHRLTTALSHL